MCACVLSHFSCVQLFCDPMDCRPLGSSVHGILQARILEWVALPLSKGSFQPRNRTWVSCISCIAGSFFTHGATQEALFPNDKAKKKKKKMPWTSSAQGISENMKVVRNLHMVSRTVCSWAGARPLVSWSPWCCLRQMPVQSHSTWN